MCIPTRGRLFGTTQSWTSSSSSHSSPAFIPHPSSFFSLPLRHRAGDGRAEILKDVGNGRDENGAGAFKGAEQPFARGHGAEDRAGGFLHLEFEVRRASQ